MFSDPVMGKETAPFGVVSKSKLLLFINTEKQFQGQLLNFPIFIEIQFPWRERLRLEHL